MSQMQTMQKQITMIIAAVSAGAAAVKSAGAGEAKASEVAQEADHGGSVLNRMKEDAREIIDDWQSKGTMRLLGRLRASGPSCMRRRVNTTYRLAIRREPLLERKHVDVFKALGVVVPDAQEVKPVVVKGALENWDIGNFVLERAAIAAVGEGVSLNLKPMRLSRNVYELYVDFVVHLPEGGELVPVD
ncbi:hypothetical protein CYMTET_5143 [Cymbomonas tetramitiformis]|uniref:Uncharacterized protein n=1 Tax=Cymbomonas tetramitiformis TaxID=36881 RepID=A0AAE0LJD2_9CHLO|nr:hypothetical protein CYMTET_5143 [Cymbomonas tetramitiformis]